MRIPIIAANWKMNTTVSEAVELVNKMLDQVDELDGVEKIVCPPFISLISLAAIIKDSSVKLGAQNMHFEEKGAYTGEISPSMLAGLCQYVIIGHSERRQYFNETDVMVNKKIKTALKFNIKPILCIGEKLEENRAGKTEAILQRQIDSALAGITDLDGTVIAYEPIWAIGTGISATGQQANKTIGFIRQRVAILFSESIARNLRILYGGSVNADNIIEFTKQAEVDGALVGGASLKADQFISIVKQTSEISGS